MNKLISSLLLVTLLVLSFASCKKTDTTISSDEEMHTVKMSFLHPEMENIYVSKVVNDKAINNVNVFFFRADMQSVHAHYYLNSGLSSFTATLPKGDYHIYALANYGSNMGDALSKEQIKAISIATPAGHFDLRGIPMSCYMPFTINSSTSLPLVLTRKAAKVEINISVASTFVGMQVNSVQLCNVAGEVEYFKQSKANTVQNYRSSISMPRYDYYIAENAQGVNSSITDQKQKGPANAPAQATYLRIDGEVKGVFVTYRVYLGANNTSDFNIIGNNQYTYDITLSGINEVDTRVTTLEYSVVNFPKPPAQKPSYTPGETAEGKLILAKTTNPDQSYKLIYNILEGSGSVLIDGKTYDVNSPFDFMLAPTATRTARVSYTQNTESDVQLHFVLTDNDGNQYIQAMTTTYGQSNVNKIRLILEQNLPFSEFPALDEEINTSVSYHVVSDYPVRSDVTVNMIWQPFLYAAASNMGTATSEWFTCAPEWYTFTIPVGKARSLRKTYRLNDVNPQFGGSNILQKLGISTQPDLGAGVITSAESNDPTDITKYTF